MSLASALRERLTRKVQGPSGLWYEVGAVVSADTLTTRAPMLLSAVTGKAKAAPAIEAAAKAAIDTLYVLACAGVTGYSVDGVDFEACKLVEGPGDTEGECSVQALPLDDLAAIADVVADVSGLGQRRRSLQSAGPDGAGRGGEALRHGPVDGGGVDARPPGAGG